MKTEQVKLSQVKVNGENPRTITKDKFEKLVNSILVFPKMLAIRPVVVDNKMAALGGNMRLCCRFCRTFGTYADSLSAVRQRTLYESLF